MNMHRTHSLALAALAAALTLSALACRPETNAPATAAPEVVTVEVTRLVAPGETAAPPLPIATVAATAEVAPPPAVVTVEVTRPALGTACLLYTSDAADE